jgi:hypothetical protein
MEDLQRAREHTGRSVRMAENISDAVTEAIAWIARARGV